MKIKMVKDMKMGSGIWIRKGEEFEVRNLPVNSIFSINQPYQIIETRFSGTVIPREYCILVEEQKKYSEKEWNDMENEYMAALEKERQEKERAQQMVRDLTEQIKNKNMEIDVQKIINELYHYALKSSAISISKAMDALTDFSN